MPGLLDHTTFLAAIGIGAVVGLLGGLFGKGGSAIATPLLHAAGVPAIVAVAAPLPATIPSTLAAASAYQREGYVDRRFVRRSVLYGIPAAALGAFATKWIAGEPLVLATDALVAVIGVRLLFKGQPAEAAEDVTDGEPPSALAVAAVAGAVGLISGLLANSGGFLLAPLYLTALRLPIRRAFGNSLAVAAFLAVPGTLVHAALGHLDLRLVLVFAAASTPLSFLGSRLALKVHANRLERLYGAVLTGFSVFAFAAG